MSENNGTQLRKLKIQVGVCKRMLKEVASYEKEVISNEGKIQKMKLDGRDPYDIRKQEEVLQESYMMVPDSKNRLEEAIVELERALGAFENDLKNSSDAVIQEARTIVSEYRSKSL